MQLPPDAVGALAPPPATPVPSPAPEPPQPLQPPLDAHPTVHIPAGPIGGRPVPPESAAELTTPLPQIPPPSRPEHVTGGLPLLDLLAPQQAQPPYQPQPQPPGAWPPVGDVGYQVPPPGQYAPDQYGLPPYGSGRSPGRPPRRPGRPGAKLVAGIAAGVLLVAVLGLWALDSSSPSTPQGDDTTTGATSPPATSAVREAGGYQFTQSAARSDADCAANAYGQVADFFRRQPCAGLDRVLYVSADNGRPAVVSVSVVRMPDERTATALHQLVDSSGTGNVADLLRAGVTVPGGPNALSDAGYASVRDGVTVVVAEADFADPAVKDEAALDRLSGAALQLRG